MFAGGRQDRKANIRIRAKLDPHILVRIHHPIRLKIMRSISVFPARGVAEQVVGFRGLDLNSRTRNKRAPGNKGWKQNQTMGLIKKARVFKRKQKREWYMDAKRKGKDRLNKSDVTVDKMLGTLQAHVHVLTDCAGIILQVLFS